MVLSSTYDCGMSTLIGNIQFSNINVNPNVTISSHLLLTTTDTNLNISNTPDIPTPYSISW